MLRNKATEMQDNGVWIATTEEHHASLRREFPKMRSIQLFGGKISGWQVLPVDAPDFETAALRASELVLQQNPRIGKVPNARRTAAGAKTGPRSKPARSARTMRSGRKKTQSSPQSLASRIKNQYRVPNNNSFHGPRKTTDHPVHIPPRESQTGCQNRRLSNHQL